MAASAKISTLGDTNVVAHRNLREVVDPHSLAQPNVVSDPQLPGEFDTEPRFGHHTGAHLRTEAAQQPDAMSAPREPGADEQPLHGQPKGLDPGGTATLESNVVELIQSHASWLRSEWYQACERSISRPRAIS